MARQKRVHFIRNMRAIGQSGHLVRLGGQPRRGEGGVKRWPENSHRLTDWLIYIRFFATLYDSTF